jgi:hypothetical protein
MAASLPDQRHQLALRGLGIVGQTLERGDRFVEHRERRPRPTDER